MTACGGRTYCAVCGHEMIHRDNRQHWESASALGQIIHRMPILFTAIDIDIGSYKRDHHLLRLIEHKQPHQQVKNGQRELLAILDQVIGHYVDCTGRLHPVSGVYYMRGDIDAATQGQRATYLAGPQTVTNTRLGLIDTIADEDELFHWLNFDGSPA